MILLHRTVSLSAMLLHSWHSCVPLRCLNLHAVLLVSQPTRHRLQVCDAYRNQDAWWDFTSLLPYLSIFPNLGTVMHVKSSGSSIRLSFTSHIHQPCFHLSKVASWIHFTFPLSMLLPRIRSSPCLSCWNFFLFGFLGSILPCSNILLYQILVDLDQQSDI